MCFFGFLLYYNISAWPTKDWNLIEGGWLIDRKGWVSIRRADKKKDWNLFERGGSYRPQGVGDSLHPGTRIRENGYLKRVRSPKTTTRANTHPPIIL